EFGLAFSGVALYCLIMPCHAALPLSWRRIPHVPLRIAVFLLLVPALMSAAPSPGKAAPGRNGPPPAGAVTALVIPVTGMTCALCTRGVETSIRGLDVVDGASADLSSGLVRVEAVGGKSLNIKDVKDRIQKAGFKVGGECEVQAIGRFGFGP